MSTIFISHSSADREEAERIKAGLDGQGYKSVFLDVDRTAGLVAGSEWEKELYRKLDVCSAVIAICSANSIESRWCFAEVTHARAKGKRIFPVRVDAAPLDLLLSDLQSIDLTSDHDAGLERLWLGLNKAGLDPADDFDWDESRPPYPGLNRFDERDAAVYFGREPEIDQVIDLLGRLRRNDRKKMAVVLGASGTGKSSLARAGVIPRLKRDEQKWLVVPTFRPRDGSVDTLAGALAEAFTANQHQIEWREIRSALSNADGLIETVRHLTMVAGRREATVLLVVDQLEEALQSADDTHAQAELLRLIVAAAQTPGSPICILATLRSDYLGSLQRAQAIIDAPIEFFSFAPMPRDRFDNVVLGPARRAELQIDDSVVRRLKDDTQSDDALPLLAFTLRELWDTARRAGSNELTVSAYQAIGGIAGAVGKRANDVVDTDKLDAETRHALRSSFLALAQIGEEDHVVRRTVNVEELPKATQGLIDEFVSARLLVLDSESDDKTIEVAHEALFRVWPTLARWLEEDRDFLLWRKRFRTHFEEWRSGGALIRGSSLSLAADWKERRGDALSQAEKDFIEKSIREERARQRRVRFIAATVMIVVLALGAYSTWQQQVAKRASENVQANAMVFGAYFAHRNEENSLAAALIVREWRSNSVDPSRRTGGISESIVNEILSEAVVPVVAFYADSRPTMTRLSADGARIVAGYSDGTTRIWSADGRSEPTVLPASHSYQIGGSAGSSTSGYPVWHAEFSDDGEYVLTVSEDFSARIWRSDGSGAPQVLQHENGEIVHAEFASDSKNVLTVSEYGEIAIWAIGQEEPVQTLSINDDRRQILYFPVARLGPGSDFLVTNAYGSDARVWGLGGSDEYTVLSGHEEGVVSVDVSNDGTRIVTGSRDGTVRLWSVEGDEIAVFGDSSERLIDTRFSNNGELVVTVGRDEVVRIWRLDRPDRPALYENVTSRPAGARFTPNDRHVISLSMRTFQIHTPGFPASTIDGVPLGAFADITQDGRFLLTAKNEGVFMWRRDPGSNRLYTAEENIEALGHSSIACLTPYERRIFLSEYESELADSKFEECEREYGRRR